MRYSAIIFDFNGTLFRDTEKHLEAWRMMAKKLRGYPLDETEFFKKINGHTNEYIIKYLLDSDVTEAEILEISETKEAFYRKLCLEDPATLHLAPGATDFIDFLNEQKIPMTIATAAEASNMRFYIEVFDLQRWFDLKKIVFHDGSFPGKPAPDIYLKAAQILNAEPQNCVVVEDSKTGIEAAFRANIGKIIAIGESGDHSMLRLLKGVHQVINDFSEISRDIFSPVLKIN